MFRHVKTLRLYLAVHRPTDWIEQLSSLVDLRTISKMMLIGPALSDRGIMDANDVSTCLCLIPNLQSIGIAGVGFDGVGLFASSYFSIVPSTVRHLTLPTMTISGCMTILKRCDHLWSLTWYVGGRPTEEELSALKQWLDENRPGSSFDKMDNWYNIWFGKERVPLTNNIRRMIIRHRNRKGLGSFSWLLCGCRTSH